MSDIYHIWANKKGDLSDHDWIASMKRFLDKLVTDGKMNSYRITRCKLGFRSITDLPEWNIQMEFDNMDHLEKCFIRVAKKEGELEKDHQGFNQFVDDHIEHALFADWPYEFK
jgi:hypothetical protein